MRDINRIEPFLKKIKDLWMQFPDYRFGQIIYVLASEMKVDDIFFPEEDEWLEAIERIMNKKDV